MGCLSVLPTAVCGLIAGALLVASLLAGLVPRLPLLTVDMLDRPACNTCGTGEIISLDDRCPIGCCFFFSKLETGLPSRGFRCRRWICWTDRLAVSGGMEK